MGLLEEARAAQEHKRKMHKPCPVAALMSTLPEDERAELRRVFADKDVDAPTIAAVLRRRDHHVGDRAVQNHRRVHIDDEGRGSCEF